MAMIAGWGEFECVLASPKIEQHAQMLLNLYTEAGLVRLANAYLDELEIYDPPKDPGPCQLALRVAIGSERAHQGSDRGPVFHLISGGPAEAVVRALQIVRSTAKKRKDTQDRRGLTKKENRQLDMLEELRFTDPRDREVALVSQALTLCPLPFRKPVGNKVERQVQIPGGILDVVFTFTGKKGKGSLAYGNDAVLLDLLCSEARLKKSPEVTFDRACELLELLGIKSDGGKDYRELKARLLRLSTLHIYVERRGEVAVNLRVVDISNLRVPSKADLKREKGGEKPLIPYAIRFSPEFFADLMGNYVPLPHAVVKIFKGSPIEYSLAKWLIHRIHIAKGESLIAWDELQLERGSVDSNMERFKLKTQNVIKKLWGAWPEIKEAVTRERGGLRIKQPQAKLL